MGYSTGINPPLHTDTVDTVDTVYMYMYMLP